MRTKVLVSALLCLHLSTASESSDIVSQLDTIGIQNGVHGSHQTALGGGAMEAKVPVNLEEVKEFGKLALY